MSVATPEPAPVLAPPSPWDPRNFPRGMKYPPGLCFWADNSPEDLFVSVDGAIVGDIHEAQLGPFGHVTRRSLVAGETGFTTITGHVEAWRPALPGSESSDTLPA